jgi:hypothetical protein
MRKVYFKMRVLARWLGRLNRKRAGKSVMDLDKVRKVADVYERLEPADKEQTATGAFKVRSYLAQSLPALSESDKAAVSWYIAQLLYGVREVDLEHASDTLTNSAAAYSVATAQLLGWAN